jgi:HEAT repeat protein
VNTILEWLAIGDLTSDGQSDEVVALVSENIQLLPDLIEAFHNASDVIRGHAADALEKVARQNPEAVAVHLPALLEAASSDPVPMVRWHLAMTLGHVAATQQDGNEVVETLAGLLGDESTFVQSWAITSLCIFARLHPRFAPRITQGISDLSLSSSAAVRTRVRKALALLVDPEAPFPKDWIKSTHIRF